ncbi:MAG: ATP-binding protein [bacterium]
MGIAARLKEDGRLHFWESIGAKILGAFLVIVFLVLNITGWIFYYALRRNLEAELGTRLANLASASASLLDGTRVRLVPASEIFREQIRETLSKIKGATALERIYIFDDEHKNIVEDTGAVPIGEEYVLLRISRGEVDRVFSSGEATSSVLYRVGQRWYKSAYAPIRDVDGRVVAALGVDASARYFDLLRRARRTILAINGVSAGIAIAVSFILARSLIVPIRRLMEAAQRVGGGDLSARASPSSRGEIGYLARVFNDMLDSLRERSERLSALYREESLRAERKMRELATLARIGGLMGAFEDVGGLLRSILDEVLNGLGVEGGAVVFPAGELEDVSVGSLKMPSRESIEMRLRSWPQEERSLRGDGEVFVPLRAEDVPEGMLVVRSKGMAEQTQEDEVFVVIASIMAQAVRIGRNISRIVSIGRYNKSILESVASGVISVDQGGRIAVCNPAARKILDPKGEGTIGQDISSLPERLRRLLEDALAGEVHSRVEFEVPAGNSRIFLGASTSLLQDERGAPLGAILVFTDLTEIRQLQRELAVRDRLAALGEMSAGIAHEIRNPLSGMRIFAEILRKRLISLGEEELTGHVETILREIRNLDDLISEFLLFARPLQMNLQRRNLKDIVDSALELFAPNLDEKNIKLILDLKPDVVSMVDDDKLKRAILNLLINAAQAIDERGTITVGLREEGDKILVSVQDTGCGIEEELRDKIFNPFFTTKDRGAGLGLSLVHKIVEGHGGSIRVESRVGEESTFTIVLPKGSVEGG